MKSLNHKAGSFQQWKEDYLSHIEEPAPWLLEAIDKASSCSVDLKIRDDFVCANFLPEILSILSSLEPGQETIAATCLHYSTLDHGHDEHVPHDTPENVGHLVRELGRIERFNEKSQSLLAADNPEGLRRLLLALISDIRVILFVLAEQLVCLKSLSKGPGDLRDAYAKASKHIYAPLANRLGIWNLKWELEDLTLRYTQPDDYKHIASLLDEKRTDREHYIVRVVQEIQEIVDDMGINANVVGRPKHIFSIWKKMYLKKLDFNQLFDVRAVRILVSSVQECYAVLGVVHNLWQPISGEFDDYIASPKGNNYQSLHTAVLAPEGKTLEIQIRTQAMDEHAERGVAAHWRYKEGSKSDPSFDKKINWLRSLLEQKDDEDEDLFERLNAESSDDRIYALTPKGKVVDLENGSTTLDFAYTVHTDVGHRCIGSKVNGRIVPLTYTLNTGEKVEILTQKNSEPSRDWMNANSTYLNSARNRSKVRQWFRLADREKNLTEGKEILERNLKQMALHKESLDPIPELFNFAGKDDLYVAIGRGDIGSNQVINRLSNLIKPKDNSLSLLSKRPDPPQKQPSSSIIVGGVGDLMTHLAQCCKPVAGEPILGYVTQGRGISVHKKNCQNISLSIENKDPRIVDVDWSGKKNEEFQVDIEIQAYDRKALLKDISAVLSNQHTEVASVSSSRHTSRGEISFTFRLYIRSVEHLSHLISVLCAIPNVIEARRLV